MELWSILAIAVTLAVAIAKLWAPLVRCRTNAALRKHVDAQAVTIDLPTRALSKSEFYAGKVVVHTLWYLHDPDLPEILRWARLRVFDDGSADSTFSREGAAFGFVDESYAGFILSEDEYVCFSTFDDEDDAIWGINRREITPPDWIDPPDKPFEFLGTY